MSCPRKCHRACPGEYPGVGPVVCCNRCPDVSPPSVHLFLYDLHSALNYVLLCDVFQYVFKYVS